MSDNYFVDTNVLVYFHDNSNPRKQARAKEWLSTLWRERTGRLSIQVLNEFYHVVTRKLSPGLEKEEARESVRALLAWDPVSLSSAVTESGFSIQDRFQLSWWDALIVSAAKSTSCRYLLTEDLQDGQDLSGITVVNPFLHLP
ncbi:MAG: PIN domain-containing protein [Deltaproteobacteria bacterium]|nr:PIN domain-containing protein [Deltaproteobacteria bacterium]